MSAASSKSMIMKPERSDTEIYFHVSGLSATS